MTTLTQPALIGKFRLFLVILACSLPLFPLACPAAGTETIVSGPFTVLVKQGPNSAKLDVRCENQSLSRHENDMREVYTDPSLENFPLPGDHTLKVNCFTGGANCCFGYYILTSGNIPPQPTSRPWMAASGLRIFPIARPLPSTIRFSCTMKKKMQRAKALP